jgi:hypothetical protein
LRPLAVHVAPRSAMQRGDGVTLTPGNQTLAGTLIDGWRQNIVAQHLRGETTIRDVFSLNAYRAAPTGESFIGQALYGDDLDSLTIDGYYARAAGWRDVGPDKNGYRHDLYSNYGVRRLLIQNAWLDEAAACGIQTRGELATVRNCLITRAAMGILAVSGRVRVEHSTIYDASHYYQPPGKDRQGRPVAAVWTGALALQTYTPLDCDDVWIVGHPDQGAPETAIKGVKTYTLGAITVGSTYTGSDDWRPYIDPATGRPPAKLLTARNCRIYGWAGPGIQGNGRGDATGWKISTRAVDVWPALELVRADMVGRRISIAQAVERGQTIIRAAAAATDN